MTQNLEAIRRFILGGMAIFTLLSKKTGDRKTFRVRASEDVTGSGKPHGFYVDLLTGPNNTEDYRYLGYMWTDAELKLGVKINRDAWGNDAFTVLRWLIVMLNSRIYPATQTSFEKQAEFHHAGLCSRCGRTLTDPDSIELGIGPVCREKAA